jgi:hypothetical protein
MEIERAWGREPGWFHTLPRDRQVTMFAWHRVNADPEGRARKARKAKGKAFWGL